MEGAHSMPLKYLLNELKNHTPKGIFSARLKKFKMKRLLLTFDDGPDEVLTPIVLNILDKFRARAVFFIIGKEALGNPDLVNHIYERGHIVANHTFSHGYELSKNYIGYRHEVAEAQRVITDITGQSPKLFRPPCGVFNFITFAVSKKFNLRTILWSNEGGEWTYNKMASAEEIANDLILSFCDRQIVLMHDNNEKIPQVLELILPYLVEEGYDLSSAVEELSCELQPYHNR